MMFLGWLVKLATAWKEGTLRNTVLFLLFLESFGSWVRGNVLWQVWCYFGWCSSHDRGKGWAYQFVFTAKTALTSKVAGSYGIRIRRVTCYELIKGHSMSSWCSLGLFIACNDWILVNKFSKVSIGGQSWVWRLHLITSCRRHLCQFSCRRASPSIMLNCRSEWSTRAYEV